MQSLITEDDFSRVYSVTAGKFRRYYGVPLWRQLLDIPTVLSNIRDLFRTIRGTFVSVRILRRERPDVVFAKGSFVSVPVAIAAKITNTPLVTHDSDTLPGLANRISSRWASVIATGAPAHYYKMYPAEKIQEVGVPIEDDVLETKNRKKAEVLQELSLDDDQPVITIIGGTHGGKEVNKAVLAVLSQLLKRATVVHVAGASNYERVVDQFKDSKLPENYRVEKIVDHQTLMNYFRVSDVVISRVGASTMAELAVLGAPTVLIPNPKLTGGHQLKNAKRFSNEKAAIVLKQEKIVAQPEALLAAVDDLLNDSKKRKSLSKNISKLAKPDATAQLARIILEVGNKG